MDFVTPAGRTEAAEIAARIGRALTELAIARSATDELLNGPEVLSPAAPQWEALRSRLAAQPYLGDVRRLQEALAAIAGPDESATAAGRER